MKIKSKIYAFIPFAKPSSGRIVGRILARELCSVYTMVYQCNVIFLTLLKVLVSLFLLLLSNIPLTVYLRIETDLVLSNMNTNSKTYRHFISRKALKTSCSLIPTERCAPLGEV